VAGTIDLAVVGDVHLCWDAEDVAHFRDAPYDLILFVGDLAGYSHRGGLRVARSIAALGRRALVMPGNHDGVHVGQLVAEVTRNRRLGDFLGAGQERRCEELAAALGEGTLCGFTVHDLVTAGGSLRVIAARPHSMGGSYVAYARYLARRFGVRSIDDSARRLQALVDDSPHRRLVFFAHSGPTGLGSGRADIWGCDFRPEEGDWGDEDLRRAITHARTTGKHVLAVVAGHMHHAAKGGGRRPWQVMQDGILYVNAARVPRIFRRGAEIIRHHVAVSVGEAGATATEVLVRSAAGDADDRPRRGRTIARTIGTLAGWLARRAPRQAKGTGRRE
jgi:uncharacterized protein (TIGR04168 family)